MKCCGRPIARRVREVALCLAVAGAGVALAPRAGAQPAVHELWRDRSLLPDDRARAAVAAMTLDEKVALVHTRVGTPYHGRPKPPEAIGSAAIWPGVPRLGIPIVQETDGSLGIAIPPYVPRLPSVTPLPSTIALAASFDPDLARTAGGMIGGQARANGFGLLLAGGVNLIRDPRDGRAFEFASEDPLLSGRIVGAVVAGIQGRGVVSTLKHFAFNDQENGRAILNARIAEEAARESDLLAFEIALEEGRPGAVMTGYNRVNGPYTSESAALLATLKHDWRFPGFVMSDWGATHSTAAAAMAGLDQESGEDFDEQPFFGAPLRQAVADGTVPQARLDDMARRILRSFYAAGLLDAPLQRTPSDLDDDAEVARRVAESGIVLLKNTGDVLPLRTDLRTIVVVGAHADVGVLSGGGSSQVVPPGAQPFSAEQPRQTVLGLKYYHPSAPADAIARRAPGAQIRFVAGNDHAAAATAARGADAVIVFAEQWLSESLDAPDLALPAGQDDLIAVVAAANPRTIVVLETGGPVKMPWLDRVPGVLEAWYPGARGGEAIADVLFGMRDPSGHLPVTFPLDESQLPRPVAPGRPEQGSNPGSSRATLDVDYDVEGADVGYRWFAARQIRPLFPFGFGLSYTRFGFRDLTLQAGPQGATVSVTVRNEGDRDGTATPQFYLRSPELGRLKQRFVGWARLPLKRGEERRATVTIDPRLMSRFDAGRHRWALAAGQYEFSVQTDASTSGLSRTIALPAAEFAP